MELLAVAGLLGVLLVKEAGVPIPVPGDLLVVGAGAALAGQPPLAVAVLVLILAAGLIGGTFQFLVMRRALREALLRLLDGVGMGRARLDALAARLRRTGARGVAVARMTPGVRVGAVAASGLADLPTGPFVRGLLVGNAVFVTAHFALGFALGASAGPIIGAVSGAVVPVAAVVVVLAAIGAAGWWLLRRVRGRRSPCDEEFGAWADATCPACLALAVVSVPDDARMASAHD
jgi:membrane protein DedA with SNARE-associated domain